jgi:hypothetical protein
LGLDQGRVQVAFGESQFAITGIQRGRRTFVEQIGFPILREFSAQHQQILRVQFDL